MSKKKAAACRFVVVKGIEYGGVRHEPESVVGDVPARDVKWLLECGAIEEAD